MNNKMLVSVEVSNLKELRESHNIKQEYVSKKL